METVGFAAVDCAFCEVYLEEHQVSETRSPPGVHPPRRLGCPGVSAPGPCLSLVAGPGFYFSLSLQPLQETPPLRGPERAGAGLRGGVAGLAAWWTCS